MRFVRAVRIGRPVILVCLALVFSGAWATGAAPLSSDVVLRTSDEGLVIFEYLPGEPAVVLLADGYAALSLNGTEMAGPAGAPELPVRRVTLGVPHGAELTIRLVRSGSTPMGVHHLRPVPRWETPTDDARLGRGVYEEDSRYYDSGLTYPENPARIILDSVFRGQRVVVVELAPFRYRTDSKDIEFIAPMTVGVEIRGGDRSAGPVPEDVHEEWFRRNLVNYDVARAWRQRPGYGRARKATAGFEQGTGWFKLGITDKGMYRVTGAMLSDAGVDLSSVDPGKMRLFSGGGRPLPEDVDLDRINSAWMDECSIWVRDGDPQGVLDSDDEIVFYGLGTQSWANDYDGSLPEGEWWRNVYTDTNVYWLATGEATEGSFAEAPRRMETRRRGWEAVEVVEMASSSVWIRAEKNRIENFGIPYEDGWMWANFDNAIHEQLFPLVLADVDTSETARLIVRVCGQRSSSARHGASVSLNGLTLGGGAWFSDGFLDVDTPADPVEGTNFVGIKVATSDTSGVAEITLAWMELQYRRFLTLGDQVQARSPDTAAIAQYTVNLDEATDVLVFDVTNQFSPARLDSVQIPGLTAVFRDSAFADSSIQYIVAAEFRNPAYVRASEPSGLRTFTGQADFLVIYHPLFEEAVERFVSHRQVDWDVLAVQVHDVYDEFSWGLFDPVAIRDFLAFAVDHYTGPGKSGPGFVLLFGDASYNYRAEGSLTIPNYVPSWHGRYRRGAGDVYSTDDWYAYLDPGDELMDVAIARFPVQTVTEAEAIVNKVIAYDASPDFGPWRTRVVIAADDLGKQCNFKPCEVVHTLDAEALVEETFPGIFNLEKIYLAEYEYVACLKREAQVDFRAAMNDGALLTMFIGHGDRAKLADEELYVWRSSEPPENAGKPTFFLAGSCDVADFAQPTGSSLGENLLRQPQSGAVAVFSSTYLAYSVFNYRLLRAMFSFLFPNQEIAGGTIGEALLYGKNLVRDSGQETGKPYHNERLELLGDPTLKLAVPDLHVEITGVDSDTVRFVRRDVVSIHGRILEESSPVRTFDGTAWVEVFGTEDLSGHDAVDHLGRPLTNCSMSHIDYALRGLPIFRGQVAVNNGEFDAGFIVPRDAVEGSLARISVYVSDGYADGAGVVDSVTVGGLADSDDVQGPIFSINESGNAVSDGSILPLEGTLVCCFEDPGGVNIQGLSDTSAVLLIIDSSEFIELTDVCQYESGSFTRACAEYSYSLQIGSHTLEVRAMDNMGNRSQQMFSVEVGEEGRLAISDVFPYPNPFDDGTYLIYELSRDADVTVRIFTVAGHPVRKLEAGYQSRGQQHVYWDGRDEELDQVANGAYLFKVDARSEGGSASALGKAMRIK
ncbi:MAG: type IX secretion system sortase PorU [Candidatus Eisenbacteria sp.]|nr:type IX secretion system sortase PorU [Candidatus Eisenbacteria bacterium]